MPPVSVLALLLPKACLVQGKCIYSSETCLFRSPEGAVQCPPPRQGHLVAPVAGLVGGAPRGPPFAVHDRAPSSNGKPITYHLQPGSCCCCKIRSCVFVECSCLAQFPISHFPFPIFPMRYIWSRSSSVAFVSPFRTRASCSSRPRPCTRATPPSSSIPLPCLIRRKKTFPFSTSAHPKEEAMTVDTSSRLAALRSLMKERNVDIYGTPPEPFTYSICRSLMQVSPVDSCAL